MEIMTDTNMIIKTKLNTYSLALSLGGSREESSAHSSCPNYVLLVINIAFPGYISQLICFFTQIEFCARDAKFIVLVHFFQVLIFCVFFLNNPTGTISF